MRIAVSAETSEGLESKVAHHFGRCPFFALIDVKENRIHSLSMIDNPFYAGHEPGHVPEFIKAQQADVMLSGGMGGRAIQFFSQFGIEPATGAVGTVEDAVNSYLEGKIQGASSCAESNAHGHGHDHNHRH